MRYAIRQNEDGTFTLGTATADGDTLTLTAIGEPWPTYEEAVAALATHLTAQHELDAAMPGPGAPQGDGLLAERWMDSAGIAFQEALPGGRDFTDCAWSWRDPAVSLLPLMFQNETAWGHDGAELAGFIEELSESGGTVHAAGRFYDSEVGMAARDLLLDGRVFGVSVDPSEAVEAEFRCTETDEEGWCVDGVTAFLSYEIAGLTMTPFPGFAEAAIKLDATPAPAAAAAAPGMVVVHAAGTAVLPDAAWFELAEPELGEPFMGTLGDEFLVDQGDGAMACPLTIEGDQVFGHLARWGQCHVGYPGMCVSPPDSAAAYAHFHVGEVRTASGARFATGALTIGCEHAPDDLDAWRARDHYANAGSGWADVRVVDGKYGPWVAGALRPGLTPEQLRVLRALVLSGDWRRLGGHLELIGALAVNTPGFPIAREAVVASGYALTATALPSGRIRNGEQLSLVAAGLVARCADCQKRRQEAAFGILRTAEPDKRIDEALNLMRTLERRTRHLIPAEAAALRTRLDRS